MIAKLRQQVCVSVANITAVRNLYEERISRPTVKAGNKVSQDFDRFKARIVHRSYVIQLYFNAALGGGKDTVVK